jgi:hypothetical protein
MGWIRVGCKRTFHTPPESVLAECLFRRYFQAQTHGGYSSIKTSYKAWFED